MRFLSVTSGILQKQMVQEGIFADGVGVIELVAAAVGAAGGQDRKVLLFVKQHSVC